MEYLKNIMKMVSCATWFRSLKVVVVRNQLKKLCLLNTNLIWLI